MPTSYYDVEDIVVPNRPTSACTVGSEFYYAVEDRRGEPVYPLPIQRFQVMTCVEPDGVVNYYAVPAEIPEGPCAFFDVPSTYLGSERPTCTSPEAAVLAYYKKLTGMIDSLRGLANRYEVEAATARQQMDAATVRRQGFQAIQEKIAKEFRTIPKIADADIATMVKWLPPVMRVGDRYARMVIPDVRNEAFTWAPKTTAGDALDLVPCGTAYTYHAWGHYGVFKPSLAEVYACIDGAVPEGAAFFWLDTASVQVEGEPLLYKPDPHCPDGYHRATITFLKWASA